MFTERYGKVPVCANNHFCRTSGWADSERFSVRRGIKGENHRVHHGTPPMDPVNIFGAVFGTVYPHFVYDDAEHGNERLDFVDIPIGLYEPGALTTEESHPFYGRDPYQPEEYRRIAKLACRYGWTLNIFLHPLYMFEEGSRSKDAVCAILDWIAETGARVLHVATDAVCLWWHARSRTRLAPGAEAGTYIVETEHGDGVLVRFAEDTLPDDAAIELDGKVAVMEKRDRRGKKWAYAFVPQGRHSLRVTASSRGAARFRRKSGGKSFRRKGTKEP